jgi:hypothetical protein
MIDSSGFIDIQLQEVRKFPGASWRFWMKVFHSIVSADIMRYFSCVRGASLMNNAANTCSIEQVLSAASIFCPEILEVNGCIFIAEFYNGNIIDLERVYEYDRKQIELYVNSWSLADFFLLAGDESLLVDEIVEEFGKTLQYFWKIRMKELFPGRDIVVELGYEIMGEQGLSITVYQKNRK